MLILYDFQEDLKNVDLGSFDNNSIISTRRAPETNAILKAVEDVRTLHIANRVARESGIFIHLHNLAVLEAGDRITVTGRVVEGIALGSNWSIALLSLTDGHLTHHVAPRLLFAVSHILDPMEITQTFTVHTIGWGVVQPLMDFYVDGILITRREKTDEAEEDTRIIVYSLAEDAGAKWVNDDVPECEDSIQYVLRSGAPTIHVFKHENSTALHVKTRINDWDGVDINLRRMALRSGNHYKITVRGRVDGDIPEGSTLMLQGVPSYAWRSIIPIKKDEEFTLEHKLSRSDVEDWTFCRITSNTPGASVAFYIYDIDIVRL